MLKGILESRFVTHDMQAYIPRYYDIIESQEKEPEKEPGEIITRISDKLRDMGNERI